MLQIWNPNKTEYYTMQDGDVLQTKEFVNWNVQTNKCTSKQSIYV